MAQLSGGRAAL